MYMVMLALESDVGPERQGPRDGEPVIPIHGGSSNVTAYRDPALIAAVKTFIEKH